MVTVHLAAYDRFAEAWHARPWASSTFAYQFALQNIRLTITFFKNYVLLFTYLLPMVAGLVPKTGQKHCCQRQGH